MVYKIDIKKINSDGIIPLMKVANNGGKIFVPKKTNTNDSRQLV